MFYILEMFLKVREFFLKFYLMDGNYENWFKLFE